MQAIRIHQYGNTDVLLFEPTSTPEPSRGEALIKLSAIGVNFIDIYHRTGLYKNPLPFTPGMEGAGIVEAVGEGVTDVKVGDRVAYAMHLGAYAEYAIVPAWKLVPLPATIDFHTAAAVMLQGMTAHYLTHSTFPLNEDHTALVHAAAGGTGQLLVQMAKLRGARVIGVVSNEEKAVLARVCGADRVIIRTTGDLAAEVKRLTDGRGVDVVYDSVGQPTFASSLQCLRPRGYLVLFGQSGGSVPAFDPAQLAANGSLFLTRPSLVHYIANRQELLWRAEDIFNWWQSQKLKVRIDRVYSLKHAAEAQSYLESRRALGKVILEV